MGGAFTAGLVVLLFLGVPIFVVLLAPVLVTLLTTTSTPPVLVVQRVFSGLDKFPLMAIPFFILAGTIMAKGGLSQRLIRLANALVSPLPGGLSMTTVTSAMFFSAISGSSPATVIAIGKIMLPALEREGYSRPFSVGLLMGSGSLGIIIPPSIFMIVYGAVTGVSIGALFLAGFGAGLIYGIAFMLVCVLYAKMSNVRAATSWDRAEIGIALRESLWGLAAPLIILGGIYGGIFTPTEAAAVAVVYASIVGVAVYGDMGLRDLATCAVESAITTAQVMIIVAAASAFAWYLTTSGLANGARETLEGIGTDPLSILLAANLIVLVAGMFLDPNSIIIIFVPLISTVAIAAGVDPIHLGVTLAVNAAIGMFTPPFGLNLFVSTGLGVTYSEAIRGSLPFIVVGLVALAFVTLVPAVTLWLPDLFY